MLEINSQKTKEGKGSKRKCFGANIFQDSHRAVQPKIIKKKPIVPTWSVIHMATLSRRLKCRRCSMFEFLIGLRSFLSSSKGSGLLFISITTYTAPEPADV